jgi:hypothetical protein
MFVLATSTLLFQAFAAPSQPPPTLDIAGPDDAWRVRLLDQGRPLLASPAEGLWSIATDWAGDWPTNWIHAHPKTKTQEGPWTLLTGELVTPSGTWQLRDAYRPQGHAWKCVRRFRWTGTDPARRSTLSVRWLAPNPGAQPVLPGILYHGNPSGAASGHVPVFGHNPGEAALFEEHRYPMPFASLEWTETGATFAAALHTLPSPAPYGHVRDQWWSLGVIQNDAALELAAFTGPCAANGRRSVVKAIQPGFVPYPDAWLEVPPGAVIEKTFYLEAGPASGPGDGFREPLWTAIDLCRPAHCDDLPTFTEILDAKYRFAKTRWFESTNAAGYRKFPDRNTLVLGWCGQAEALGYALQVLEKGLGDPAIPDRVQRSLDTLSRAEFYPGGFRTWFDPDTGVWSHDEPLSQGQAMLAFARAIRVGRTQHRDTQRWEAFLLRAGEFHTARILADSWRPRSTAEAFFIAPLCEASRLFDRPAFQTAALKAADHYAARGRTLKEPYWGGTLDAQCEDKEGAYAAFQGFLAAYELTKEPRFLDFARHAADLMLTYLVIWDIDLPAGRLRDHGMKTRGWTVVSPQNQHIDAYGVLMAPDLYRLGQILDRRDLCNLAVLMFRACGQIIDPFGSQGEQPHHTNYGQTGRNEPLPSLRGGYNETWTVFWLTAHFLNAAARFSELGFDVWARSSP